MYATGGLICGRVFVGVSSGRSPELKGCIAARYADDRAYLGSNVSERSNNVHASILTSFINSDHVFRRRKPYRPSKVKK